MEGLFYQLILIIIGLFVVIPIVLLIKLNSANRKLDFMQSQINSLNKKILDLVDNLISKQDITQVIEKSPAVTDKQTETVQGYKEVTQSVEILSEVKEEIIQEDESKEMFDAATETMSSPLPYDSSKSKTRTSEITERKQRDSFSKNLIERIFGENWLPKIGIVTLVLGVAFFVKYAIDQNWINEIGRVGVGILSGAVIIGIAHKLKERYKIFSSLLVGGGISIFYISITLAFREYALFSQSLAFVLLTVITIFSVILSLYYNRQELAVFSLIGGFASPLMVSTGSGNYIVLFSFLLILNAGMLTISLRRNWRLIGIISYILSLFFFWIWLANSFHDQFTGATIFASLFFIQFYLLAIIKHFREQKKLSLFQAILILTNNLSILLALMLVFNNSYEYDIKGLVVIMIALVNAIIMLSLFKDSKVDKHLIYLIIGVVMSFVTLAIPVQLQGYIITMFWAIEMIVLLWLWQKTQINVFRLGFLALGLLSIISYLMDINKYYVGSFDVNLNPFINSPFITGIVVILGFAVSFYLLKKEDMESKITFRKQELFSMKSIKTLFKFIVILLLFFVPYLEFNHQLGVYTDTIQTDSFRHLTLATYATCFVAALGFLFRKKMNRTKYIFFSLCIILYSLVYTWLTAELRLDIFYYSEYSSSYFLMHLFSLPAIGYLIYLLVVYMKTILKEWIKIPSWGFVILSSIILSVELDNVAVLLLGNAENYFSILYDVHTFGYPILWGVIAMVLMIWGVKKKEVVLRQISLISFGLIILKFYAYDVWLMSQTGRIISFVLLGVIILVVSFIQQKLKTLVKEDNQPLTTDNKNKES